MGNSTSLVDQARNCQNGTREEEDWCPTIWDGLMCWNSTPPDEMVTQRCPVGYDVTKNATKICLPHGQWFFDYDQNTTWTNYTQCDSDRNYSIFQSWLPPIKNFATIAYTISIISLIVAFLIFARIRKLRCSRNMLHMHLFASFILRGIMFYLREIIFAPDIDMLMSNAATRWRCKILTGIWQYCIMANYCWILMESLYMCQLIFRALHVAPNESIGLFVGLGWGLPFVIVGTWVGLRVLYENDFCWTMNNENFIFDVIRVPITIVVVINFVLFLVMLLVLCFKLRSESVKRYTKWFRSMLILAQLFGAHYIVFTFMYFDDEFDESSVWWIFFDQSITSCQGFLLAVFVCFTNSEVQVEVGRLVRSDSWLRRLRLCFLRNWRSGPAPGESDGCSCRRLFGHLCNADASDRSTPSVANTQVPLMRAAVTTETSGHNFAQIPRSERGSEELTTIGAISTTIDLQDEAAQADVRALALRTI